MPDFTKLMDTDLDEIKAPPAWPAGHYPARITGWTQGESSQKHTPYVRVTVGLMGWPDDLDDDSKEGFTLEGKTFNCDYYEAQMPRLRDALKSIGATGTLREALEGAVGSDITVDVTQEMGQRDGQLLNRASLLAE